MGKLFTFSEAVTKLRPFVENGTCKTSVIADRLNEAVQRLIVKPEMEQSPRLNFLVRFQIANHEFALPRGVEKIIAADLDGTPGHVFNKMYQFLSSGPGDLRCTTSWANHLMDLGEFPYQFPIPCSDDGRKLVAFTTKMGETTKLKVWGYDWRNRELYEELTINGYQGGVEGQIGGLVGTAEDIAVSTNAFKEITKVVKSSTSTPVVLYAFDGSTNKMWYVAKYHPKDTIPSFRRYRITGKSFHTGESDDARCDTCILAMVKMGFVELSEDDDIVPVDSVSALRCMLIALKYELEGDIGKAAAYEANAVRLLNDVASQHHQSQGLPTVIDHERRLSMSRINRYPYI